MASNRKQFFDLFNPNEGRLPVLPPGYQQGFWWSLAPGTLNIINDTSSVSTFFNRGDYLIYEKGETRSIYYKAPGDLVSLSKDGKPLLDETQIRNFEDIFYEYIENIFASETLGNVKFTFNRATNTINAEVRIDEETIRVNQYGQLTSGDSTITDPNRPGPALKCKTPYSIPRGENIAVTDFITLESDTPFTTIYYTLDGTQPTKQSALYVSPFQITSNVALRAYAIRTNYEDSEVFARNFILHDVSQVATPQPSKLSGEVVVGTPISLSCSTPDAYIIYTLNGSTPSQNNGFKYTNPIPIIETTTIKAIAIKSGMFASNIMTETYMLDTSGGNAPHIQITISQVIGLEEALKNIWFEINQIKDDMFNDKTTF